MKNSQILTLFVKIAQILAFLPTKWPNFFETLDSNFNKFVNIYGQKTEKCIPKRSNFDQSPYISIEKLSDGQPSKIQDTNLFPQIDPTLIRHIK